MLDPVRTTASASLDRLAVSGAVSEVENFSDDEIDRLIALWHSPVGSDLAMARTCLTSDEKAVLDWSADVLSGAAFDRLRRRRWIRSRHSTAVALTGSAS